MEKDFFTEFSENLNGLDIAFGVIGLLWLAGTLLGISNMSAADLLVAVPVWAGYGALYWWVKKQKIKSNWRTVTLTVITLLIWKAAVQVGISTMLA